MSKILEELYYGNIRPDTGAYEKNSSFAKTAQLKKNNYEKLIAALSASEKDLLDKFMDASGEMEGLVRYDTFTYAFKLGALLMVETFMGAGQITGDDEVL